MSHQVTADVNRHLADFHPTVWGNYFLKYAAESDKKGLSSWIEEADSLREEVRKMFTDNKIKQLELVDAIQRLGIAYHFESEIEKALGKIFRTHQHSDNLDDLYTAALQFRLLRQQGYHVSSDVFNKLKDSKGSFKEDVTGDVKGMLSLYEASHLSVHGEDTLDEALAFTTAQLESIASQSYQPLAGQISHSLRRPIRRSITRQEAWHYISIYEQNIEALLKLAKLEFNIVQKMHQAELSSITKWWNDLEFARKLPFARDRIVECYFWPLGVFFEPKFAAGRSMLTKAIATYSVIDDVYDAYGTLKELQLFTEVVLSFDAKMMDRLPEYMQVTFQALLDLYSEFEAVLFEEGRSASMFYVKEATKKLVSAYLVEARWFHENYVPTVEEYMQNGLVTSVYPLLIAISFLGMGDIASKEAFDWLSTEPKIVKAASAICRIMDDIVSHKFEQNRGHVASAVECYMKQHNVSEQQAYYELNIILANAWKDINEEILKPSAVPAVEQLLLRILNFARVIYVVYKDEDGYTHSKHALKDALEILLLSPLAV